MADSAWRWVLDQVRWDDGPWIPDSLGDSEIPADRDGIHSGIGGLTHVLEEIQLHRPWTSEEQTLAEGIAARLRAGIPTKTDVSYFDGLVSDIGVFTALGVAGAAEAVQRLQELAEPEGWPQTYAAPPRYLPGARVNDMTLGTAGVLLGALWARRNSVDGAGELAAQAITRLQAEAEETPAGLSWRFVPQRFLTDQFSEMPNLSHGLAGIAATLAIAGAELDRPELITAARGGAEQLVTLNVSDEQGFVVPRMSPVKDDSDLDPVTYNWCHGPAGTSLLFAALTHAGVPAVAGQTPLVWRQRCLHSVRTSGLPERLYPGFWDNDGRCCGTTGVADVLLDSWQATGDQADLKFALQLADTLAARAVRDGSSAYWRFIEHRNDDPLLPPGVGWMQGAAGISAYLYRAARVTEQGSAAAVVPRMDTWWATAAG